MSLTLADGKGQVRLVLSTDADGPELTLLDPNRQKRADLLVAGNGCPLLQLRDRSGRVRLGASVDPAGAPALALHGDDGPRATLAVRRDGSGHVGPCR